MNFHMNSCDKPWSSTWIFEFVELSISTVKKMGLCNLIAFVGVAFLVVQTTQGNHVTTTQLHSTAVLERCYSVKQIENLNNLHSFTFQFWDRLFLLKENHAFAQRTMIPCAVLMVKPIPMNVCLTVRRDTSSAWVYSKAALAKS